MTDSASLGLYLHENIPLPLSTSTEPFPRFSQDSHPHPSTPNENKPSPSTPQIQDPHRRHLSAILTAFKRHSTRPTINLDDLSTLLYTRGTLQQMGCTFTALGELVTYGNPSSREEFDYMLRLGPIYATQWECWFLDGSVSSVGSSASASPMSASHVASGASSRSSPASSNGGHVCMWPDLLTLQKVLANEGVEFGWEQRRITHGDMSYRIVRLCNAYDELRTIWAATEQPFASNLGNTKEQRNGRYDTVMEHDSSGTTGDEEGIVQDKAPQNLGWRFSEDVEQTSINRGVLAQTGEDEDDMSAILEMAVAIPLPVATHGISRPSSPAPAVQTAKRAPSKWAAAGPKYVAHASSLSKKIDGDAVKKPNGVLGSSHEVASSMSLGRKDGPAIGTTAQKGKALKRWLDGVLGRK